MSTHEYRRTDVRIRHALPRLDPRRRRESRRSRVSRPRRSPVGNPRRFCSGLIDLRRRPSRRGGRRLRRRQRTVSGLPVRRSKAEVAAEAGANRRIPPSRPPRPHGAQRRPDVSHRVAVRRIRRIRRIRRVPAPLVVLAAKRAFTTLCLFLRRRPRGLRFEEKVLVLRQLAHLVRVRAHEFVRHERVFERGHAFEGEVFSQTR